MTDIRPFVPAILFQGKKKSSESESSDTPQTPSEGETDKSEDKQTEQEEEEEEGVDMLYFSINSTSPLICRYVDVHVFQHMLQPL